MNIDLTDLEKLWQKEKPDYACIFVTRSADDYQLWRFEWQVCDPPDDVKPEDYDKTWYYLAWTTIEGDEWDDIKECNFDEYLVLDLLPTLEETEEV